MIARHLKRDEVIDPPTELGKFRGDPVYPRSSVISLKTAENWMRQGRVIRPGCQPMKMVKQRAVTISRQREMELALECAKAEGQSGGDEEVMQGLYALSQTELYKPDPIRDVRATHLNYDISSIAVLCRVKYEKMSLATLIYMYRQCFQREQSTFHVGVGLVLARPNLTSNLCSQGGGKGSQETRVRLRRGSSKFFFLSANASGLKFVQYRQDSSSRNEEPSQSSRASLWLPTMKPPSLR